MFIIICTLFSICGALTNAEAANTYPESIVQVSLGMNTTRNQTWDGSVHVSEGEVIAIPFPIYSHSEFFIYSQRISRTSWKLLTNFSKGGLYLILRCPEDAVITVDNATFPFSFSLRDLRGKDQLSFNNGNIDLRDRTGTYFYARTGMEIGLCGEGEATIEPTTAKVNSPGTWTIRFTVGESGIPVGGGIRVSLHQSRAWGAPQFSEPRGENYITVSCSNESATLDYISPNAERGWPYTNQIVLIRVKNKPLKAGDRVVITRGDKSKGSPGFRSAQTNESYADFRVETCTQLNDYYFPIYRRIRDCPIVTIVPDKAEKAYLVAPSIVKPNETFTIAMRFEDAYRNVASGFEGTLALSVEGKQVKNNIRVGKNDRGIVEIPGVSLDRPGIYQFTVEGDGIAGKSNPVRCMANPDYRLYWGELHCHTYYSDGFGTKQEMWSFLRDVARLDYASVTDHDVEADSQDYTSMDNWEDTQITSALFNKPYRFVTFPGWEWSPHRYSINGDHPYGDHNVFFFEEDPARVYLSASSEQYNTTDKLFAGLDILGEKAIVIPHVGGNVGQWDIHNDKWQPLGEIVSVHGSFEGFGQLALDKYKREIGFIGSGDNHNGQGGGFPPSGVSGHYMNGGLAGTYAVELTRDSIFDALSHRRVYATSGPRIYIDFRIKNVMMGSEIKTGPNQTLTILARGEEPIWKAEIIKNGVVAYTWINDDIEDKNVITLLWRNWYAKERFDRVGGGGGGIPVVKWDGGFSVAGAEIESFHPCSFHLLKDRIIAHDGHSIQWTSSTRGDWDGISFKLKNINGKVAIDFKSKQKSFTLKPAEMKKNYLEMQLDATNEIVFLKGAPVDKTVSFSFDDKNVTGEGYYYVRVTQVDGEQGWASPIYYTAGDNDR